MKKILILLTFLIILIFSSVTKSEDLTGKKILCEKFLWGFDFFSSKKVRVITTNYNNVSTVKEYYYGTDDYLPYINMYEFKNINNANYSINRETLRVDIWTMTAGGYTSREIISEGSCKLVKINNIINYIEDLKNSN
tara:strand:+ start:65 stop:475 length:411 start_codon:yes stop_codon:yes gene_type:complete